MAAEIQAAIEKAKEKEHGLSQNPHVHDTDDNLLHPPADRPKFSLQYEGQDYTIYSERKDFATPFYTALEKQEILNRKIHDQPYREDTHVQFIKRAVHDLSVIDTEIRKRINSFSTQSGPNSSLWKPTDTEVKELGLSTVLQSFTLDQLYSQEETLSIRLNQIHEGKSAEPIHECETLLTRAKQIQAAAKKSTEPQGGFWKLLNKIPAMSVIRDAAGVTAKEHELPSDLLEQLEWCQQYLYTVKDLSFSEMYQKKKLYNEIHTLLEHSSKKPENFEESLNQMFDNFSDAIGNLPDDIGQFLGQLVDSSKDIFSQIFEAMAKILGIDPTVIWIILIVIAGVILAPLIFGLINTISGLLPKRQISE